MFPKLPPVGSDLNDLFAVEDLSVSNMVGFRTAKNSAVAMMAKDAAIKSVNFMVLRADAKVQLMNFGPKGGSKILWNFGNLATGF
jgi:hypothetical protein